jgi:hypothetical protein
LIWRVRVSRQAVVLGYLEERQIPAKRTAGIELCGTEVLFDPLDLVLELANGRGHFASLTFAFAKKSLPYG